MGIGKLRNNPCVCGNNKKYKWCCWGKKENEISYNHTHVRDNPQALCITCREESVDKAALAVKSALPAEPITAEL